MKTLVMNETVECAVKSVRPVVRPRAPRPIHLHLLTTHDLENLRHELSRGNLPLDLEAKLNRLSQGDLGHRFIEQNCRTMIALLQAAQEGAFTGASVAECERLLQVLAYVRKDDDAIPDYRSDGFLDDQQSLEEKVYQELYEELGLPESAIVRIAAGQVFDQDEPKYHKTWIVHPVLVEVNTEAVKLDWEAGDCRWVTRAEAESLDLLPGFDRVLGSLWPID